MPDRYVRESLLSSQRWNDLPASAQVFYIRLVLVVDDFGCFDGREQVIEAHCYPTQRADVSELLATLHAADMLVRYSNAGKPYIALTRWQNELRGKRKYPAPPINNEWPETKLAGKFSRPIGWRNPPMSDPVSILLDAQMRPTVPQPREWRAVGKDYAPVTEGVQPLSTVVDKPQPHGAQALDTSGAQGLQASSRVVTALQKKLPEKSPEKKGAEPPAAQHGEQGLTLTAPSGDGGGNGKIELSEAGEWRGLSEAQRLRWQDMFPDLRVPEQLQRAGEWLLAHDEERIAYSARGELGEYLIRWLLREARGHQ